MIFNNCLLLLLLGIFLSAGPAAAKMYVYGTTLPGQLWYFDLPYSVAVDPAGNVYIADTPNQVVLKYNSAGVLQGTLGVTGVAGSDNGHFNMPYGVAADANFIYVADANNHRVQKFDAATLAHMATLGVTGVSGADITHLNQPNGVAVDSSGNVYVADTFNNRVQIFTSGGTSTLSGFNSPFGVAVGGDGRVYVADSMNFRIQVYDAGLAYLATIGQTGSSGIDNSHFDTPQGVAVDVSGNIYVADTNNHRVQKCSLSGDTPPVSTCSTFVGETSVFGIENAHLTFPSGVAVDGSGNVYIADTQNYRIQMFNGAGAYAGTWGSRGSDNGHFYSPNGVAVDGAGNMHVADTGNHRIQKFNPAGAYSSTLGESGISGADDAHFYFPMGVATGTAHVYVADTYNNRVQKFALSDYSFSAGIYGLNSPMGVAADSAGNIFVADTGNNVIRKYSASGFPDTEFGGWGSGNGQFDAPSGIAVDSSGNIYVADTNNHRIQKCSLSGDTPPVPTCSTFLGEASVSGTDNTHLDMPGGVAVDGSGNIYVADTNNHRVQGFTAGGAWLLTLGEAAVPGFDTGHFDMPGGVAVDASRDIYVADANNHRIQKFLPVLVTPVTNSATLGTISCQINGGDASNVTCTALPTAGSYIQVILQGAVSCFDMCAVAVTPPSYTFTGITEDMKFDVTFQSYPVKRVSGSSPFYHMTLSEAYAAASEGDTVRMQASTQSGGLVFNKSLTLEGGYTAGDPAFNLQFGQTTIDGGAGVTVTVGTGGRLIFDRIMIH